MKQEPKILRVWAMPNKWTFTIKPIADLLERYVLDGKGWLDPFAGFNSPAEFTNDLNPNSPAQHHLKALDYCKQLTGEYKGVLFDPPYSGRQVKECYTAVGIETQRDDTNAFFYWSVKREIAPRIKEGGIAISFGWNTNGFGKSLGFELIEILIVPHGASHNDTLVVVERKVSRQRQKQLLEEAKASGVETLRAPPTTEVVGIRAGDSL